MNNMKKMFFIVALMMLIIGLSSVASAADDTATDSVISESPTDTTVEHITTPTSSDTTVKDNNKIINKTTRENVKTATKTVEVNNYNELTTAINSAVQDADNNEYVINLNAGTYEITANTVLNAGTNTPSITINANNQTLSANPTNRYTRFNNSCNITINDAIITQKIEIYTNNIIISNSTINNSIWCYRNMNLTLSNSYVNTSITNYGNITICDDVVFGENFHIDGDGHVISNRTDIAQYLSTLHENYTIENQIITSGKENYGNLTIRNSTINSYGLINNYGNIELYDTFINYTVRNRNNANLTIFNSQINASIENGGNTIIDGSYFTYRPTNNGNMTIKNSTMIIDIQNDNGNLTICDDVIFGENFYITGAGNVISNRTDLATYLTVLNGTYVLENQIISISKSNYGNLTIRNATINRTISNYGNLTICDDVIFGENFAINDYGQTIINDTDKLIPYMMQFNGTYVIENLTAFKANYNYGNLTIINSTMNKTTRFTNAGTLILKNSTINQKISNSGTLIICDDVIIGPKLDISGDGEIIINDTSKIAPYISTYNGNYIFENSTISSTKTNNGNLTIRNCTITAQITNNGNLTIEDSKVNGALTNAGNTTIENSTITKAVKNTGNLTLKNCTINQRITNNGILTIDDDVVLGTSFSITGSGHVYTNNISKIFPYLQGFYEEGIIELGTYTKQINNYGKLTIENSTLNGIIWGGSTSETILKNTTTTGSVTNSNKMTFTNATINGAVTNNGVLTISDDTVIGPNFSLKGNGDIIMNDTQKIADYLTKYTGNIVLTNKTINTNKVNLDNLTLNNCTIDATIENNGKIYIDENTVFTENGKITGNGEIITDNITRLLPYISAISGNYTITDTTLNKSYTFNGNVTLENCNITTPNNSNFGTLTLNHCDVNVGEENIFLDNFGTLYVSEDTTINGKIENLGGEVIHEDTHKTYIVNNRTATYFFQTLNEGRLSSIVNPGDTLDFQGTISGIPELTNITIDKAINIISTTKDAVIDLNTTAGDLTGSNPGNRFTINKEGSYTNVTGIYFHNTQLWLYNTDHVTLDNISAVVEDQRVGSGVGQTSIRANSSYVTVKNSYFYTRNNGGSSTLVLAYANYCDIINNTIVGGGGNGNMLYLTTYNVAIPDNATFNSHNNILNNTIIGPETAASICYGICISGSDNLVDGNTINYTGSGIMMQWGSGVDGVINNEESLFNSSCNIISNNKLYRGSGIMAGDIIYDNYMEGTLRTKDAIAFNNTAGSLEISDGKSVITDNIINGEVTTTTGIEYALLANNTINGNINIASTASNITFNENNITGTVTLDGSGNVFTNNRIISEEEYTIESRRACTNNVITDNYLMAANNAGDDSVKLKDPSNTIENNIPINTVITIIAQNETTVNTTIPVTIILSTTKGNLIKEQEITVTTNTNETVTAKNGIIIGLYTPTAIGENTITVTYNGHDDYLPSTNNITITATPDKNAIIEELNNTLEEMNKNCLLTIDSIPDIKFNDNLTIYGKLMDTKGTGIAGEQVTVNVNGVDNTVTTDANGVWKLKIKTTTLGTNNVTATYTGTAYNPYTTGTTFEIAQTEAIITIDKIVTTQFRDNVTITGTFKNSNGKAIANSKVRVNVNGYSTYVTTDHDGVWSLTVKTNKTGINNVTASFTGNANYAKYTANATFNVTKQDLVITTEVKYNKGNFTITGTFVDKNGNKLSNSKIRVNINGKAVYVKTDSNGTYTYSEMITTKTIKYNVYYGGSANYNSYTSSKTTLTVV